jgi:uncharacterized protein YhbP (UPF0306 family)
MDEVRAGKLMQVATLDASGQPHLCHAWYSASFDPDRLLFISKDSRRHSLNIRADSRVGGAIIADVPSGLGATVRGVSFTGVATELPATDAEERARAFLTRWPQAEPHLTSQNPSDGPVSRLYEIAVSEWVLFDEEAYPDQPRRLIQGQR